MTERPGKKSSYLVRSKVKEEIRASEMQTAGDALDALDGMIHAAIEKAIVRARADGRKTIRAHDF